MTGNPKRPQPKGRHLRKGTATLLVSALWSIWFSSVANAQRPAYSADSLMAAFDKSAKLSPKGTEITFTGVVVERKKSKVIFKSSGNDKVICELSAPVDSRQKEVSVGSALTVIGKVKGRGILRNVTLDACRLAPPDAGRASVEVPSKEPTIAKASAEAPEVAAEKPVPARNQEPNAARTAEVFSTETPSPAQPANAAATPKVSAIPDERPCFPGSEQPRKVVASVSNSTNLYLLNAWYILFAVFGGFALLALVKIGQTCLAARSATSQNTPVTAEVRRDALEALLSDKKKKKWLA